MNIDEKFTNGNLNQPVACTVGELIEILKELPPELPISDDGRHASMEVVVFNVDGDDTHMSLEQIEETLICEL